MQFIQSLFVTLLVFFALSDLHVDKTDAQCCRPRRATSIAGLFLHAGTLYIQYYMSYVFYGDDHFHNILFLCVIRRPM